MTVRQYLRYAIEWRMIAYLESRGYIVEAPGCAEDDEPSGPPAIEVVDYTAAIGPVFRLATPRERQAN